MTRMLNIAYIGNGKSTNRYHLPFVLTRSKTFHVSTIYERHRGTSAWAYHDCIAYTDRLDDVLDNPDIDLVVICTKHDSHHEYAMRCLKAGKNILVEKPFTLNVKDAEEIFSYAHEHGLFASAYQNRRFDSDFLTLRCVIESGRLGDVYEIVEHFDYWRPEIPNGVQKFTRLKSFVYGHAVHTLDQAVGLLGMPRDVRYDARQLLGAGRMNDYYDIDLDYGTLRYSVRSSYFRAVARPSFEAYGTKGAFIKVKPDRQEEHLKMFYLPEGHPDFGIDRSEDYGTLTYYDEAGFHEEKVISKRGDYGLFYDSIYETLVNGAEQLVRPEQTLAVMRMCEAAVSGLS